MIMMRRVKIMPKHYILLEIFVFIIISIITVIFLFFVSEFLDILTLILAMFSIFLGISIIIESKKKKEKKSLRTKVRF